MSDLKPLIGAEFVRASEPADNEGRAPSPVDANGQPISQRAAHDYFRSLIGLKHPTTLMRTASQFWDRLAAASSTPEERLGCERMIRAAYMACGMGQHRWGAALEKENKDRHSRQHAAEAEARALARWS